MHEKREIKNKEYAPASVNVHTTRKKQKFIHITPTRADQTQSVKGNTSHTSQSLHSHAREIHKPVTSIPFTLNYHLGKSQVK
jgi:hypothetical protein